MRASHWCLKIIAEFNTPKVKTLLPNMSMNGAFHKCTYIDFLRINFTFNSQENTFALQGTVCRKSAFRVLCINFVSFMRKLTF
jgi:hypothetical protein